MANEQLEGVLTIYEKSCQIRMGSGQPCSRPIHDADIDAEPRCLMHSADPLKSTGQLNIDFFTEVEVILQRASSAIADFTYFMFPRIDFRGRLIAAACNFFDATFADEALFERAVFQRNVRFERAGFRKSANFHQTTFTHEADFYYSDFEKTACFAECAFERDVYFSSASFHEGVDFHGAKFMKGARFRLTKFFKNDLSTSSPHIPSPIFSLASFPQPQNVLFYKTDLSRALFMNCDISKISFSKVAWLRRFENGKRMLYEEKISLGDPHAEPLRLGSLEYEDLEARELTREIIRTDGVVTASLYRDYSLIADTYQQLRKNYDSRGDYWKAGDFHYGEMEMQRLSIRPGKDWLRFRQWWHPRLSFVAWYKYTSAYGESFSRPLFLLVTVLLFFTMFYPLAGIRHSVILPSDHVESLTYSSVWPSLGSFHDRFWAEVKVLGQSAIAAIDTATFQRTMEYNPSYPWGRVGAIVEALLTSTLFAFILTCGEAPIPTLSLAKHVSSAFPVKTFIRRECD